jgi:hypothetical protein
LGAPPVAWAAAGEGAIFKVRVVLGVGELDLELAVGEALFGVGGKE